ncbi:MAG: hypothetical protein KDB00_22250 [Planctomycetales bacterium]|nr:hypothetical protein [Planctomycetales bacterium]
MDMLWLALVSALLILWYKDHQSLANQIASVNTRSNWSIQQVLGQPDTPRAGDFGTAWASSLQDSGVEWLVVEFPRSVDVAKIQIEETYNPGAVNRVCSVDFTGRETEIWSGKDPTAVGSSRGSSMIVPSQTINSRRLKIYLDSANVLGWNEIDAIALHGTDGSIQWATDAWASSSFGSNQRLPSLFWP